MGQFLIGQHFVIGISGQALTEDEKKFIIKNDIGGIILMGRNVSEPQQVHALCSEIQSLRHQTQSKLPFFISIDMEGGRVARLKAPFTQWPALRKLGEIDSPTVSFHFARCMGAELHAVGINLDFAPCVDVFSNPKNTVIGDRSISSDPELVAKHASALIRGYMKSEVIPCAKHFPGHGDTVIDSHLDLPVEKANLQRLESFEFIPFKKSFKSRIPMVMSAHIKFPEIDPEWPATLSEIFMTKILREDLRFRGLIITDDLDMNAMKSYFGKPTIPVRALQAGVDLLLYCNEPESPVIAIEAINKAIENGSLKESVLAQRQANIIELKKSQISHPDPIKLDAAIKIIGHADHFKLAQSILAGQVPDGLIGMS